MPLLGCVTSLELWSEQTGELVESGQLRLINKYNQFEVNNGYMIQVDLEDKNEPVQLKIFWNILCGHVNKF